MLPCFSPLGSSLGLRNLFPEVSGVAVYAETLASSIRPSWESGVPRGPAGDLCSDPQEVTLVAFGVR